MRGITNWTKYALQKAEELAYAPATHPKLIPEVWTVATFTSHRFDVGNRDSTTSRRGPKINQNSSVVEEVLLETFI